VRTLPETFNRQDWPRLVAKVVNENGRAIGALEAPFAVRTLTVTGAALVTDYLLLVDATAGAVTVNLPAVADSEGAYIIVKKTDASVNAVTVDADGAETIDGAATQVLTAQYDAVTVLCDGSAWWIA